MLTMLGFVSEVKPNYCFTFRTAHCFNQFAYNLDSLEISLEFLLASRNHDLAFFNVVILTFDKLQKYNI
jgi:hypothetical protein